MSAAPKTIDDLAVITPSTMTLDLSIGRIEISPIKVKQLPAFTKAISPLLSGIMQGEATLDLITSKAEDVINAVCAGAMMSREAVDALEIDELVKLGSAVLEVNADFFMKRVLPQLNQSAERLNQALAGQTLLLGLSTMATV
ncbi:MAG: hypothetical protein Q8S55_23770 [Methylococcaceae bacterium]|nr:hypothetical protein [Methylococcaceae bacterium]